MLNTHINDQTCAYEIPTYVIEISHDRATGSGLTSTQEPRGSRRTVAGSDMPALSYPATIFFHRVSSRGLEAALLEVHGLETDTVVLCRQLR